MFCAALCLRLKARLTTPVWVLSRLIVRGKYVFKGHFARNFFGHGFSNVKLYPATEKILKKIHYQYCFVQRNN